MPLNTIFVHSDVLSSASKKNDKTIKSVIILSTLKNNYPLTLPTTKNLGNHPISELKKTEQNHQHNKYQLGIKSLIQQVKESFTAYHWLLQLKNRDFLIRLEAVKELGQLGSDTALQALYLALGDNNKTVREEAKLSLKEIDNTRWFNSIEEQLKNKNQTIQNFALDIVKTQKGDRWIKLLETLVKNKNLSRDFRKKVHDTLLKIKER